MRWFLFGQLMALAALTGLVGAHWAPLTRLDLLVARHAYAATHGHSASTRTWELISTRGGPWVMRAVVALAGVALAASRRYARALGLLTLTVLEALVAPTAKAVLDRPRPHWEEPIVLVGSKSYPSGHAAAAAMLATVLVLAASRLRRRVARLALTAVALALIALVAASRVFLGVHYLSDVCAGALLGSGLTLVVWSVAQRIELSVSARDRTRAVLR